MEEASLQLVTVLSRCKESTLSLWDLKSSKILLKKHYYSQLKKNVFILLALIFTSILFIVFQFFLINTQCSIGLPDSVRKAFRPPVTCEFCSTVLNVQKFKRISRDEFEKRYAYSGIPIVISDATSNWSSITTFDFWYFKETYNKANHKQKILNCQFFPYKSGFKNLYEALENPPENVEQGKKAWYFGWSNCNPETAEELRQHYGRPYFLPETSENNAVDWIFMGISGLGAHMHVDNVRLPSWQAQLSGSKRWILMPPPECYFLCNRVEVVVDEGDINTNKWYHQTVVLPGKISITIGAEYD